MTLWPTLVPRLGKAWEQGYLWPRSPAVLVSSPGSPTRRVVEDQRTRLLSPYTHEPVITFTGKFSGESRACVPLRVVAQMSNPLRVGIALGTGLHDTRHSQKLDGRSNVSLQFPARFLHEHVRHVRLRVPPPQSACKHSWDVMKPHTWNNLIIFMVKSLDPEMYRRYRSPCPWLELERRRVFSVVSSSCKSMMGIPCKLVCP